MKNYYEQAKALREQVAELDELIHNCREDEPEKYEQEADQLWSQHCKLLKKVYPSPNPQDKIQVKLGDYYRDNALVLATSFTDLRQYKEAYDQLGWD